MQTLLDTTTSLSTDLKSQVINGNQLSGASKINGTDSISLTSASIRIAGLTQGWYEGLRANFCTKTNDPTNDQYIKGTLNFTYTNPGTTAKTPLVDTCVTDSTTHVSTLTEYVCSGINYDSTANQTITCPSGCGDGVCLRGSLGTAPSIVSDTTGTTVLSNVLVNQAFYLKMTPQTTQTGLTATVTSPALPTDCTLTTATQTVSGSTPLYFGPIKCTTSGDKAFTFTLKNGTDTIGTPVAKTVTISTITAGSLSVSVPSTITQNTEFSITVAALGSDGLAFTGTNSPFYVIMT